MKKFDLEERTFVFAKHVRTFVKTLPRTIANIEDAKQLIRSSGSIGANYIEANEALSKKDFIHRLRISKKEAKETRYWLQLLNTEEQQKELLIEEATALIKIFSSIIEKNVAKTV